MLTSRNGHNNIFGDYVEFMLTSRNEHNIIFYDYVADITKQI